LDLIITVSNTELTDDLLKVLYSFDEIQNAICEAEIAYTNMTK
jgi:hypothetical protein